VRIAEAGEGDDASAAADAEAAGCESGNGPTIIGSETFGGICGTPAGVEDEVEVSGMFDVITGKDEDAILEVTGAVVCADAFAGLGAGGTITARTGGCDGAEPLTVALGDFVSAGGRYGGFFSFFTIADLTRGSLVKAGFGIGCGGGFGKGCEGGAAPENPCSCVNSACRALAS